MEIASDSIALRYVFSLPVIEKLAVPHMGTARNQMICDIIDKRYYRQ